MLFNLKYLGMTLVEQPKGEELSAAAVKRIAATVSPARAMGWGALFWSPWLNMSDLSLPLSPLHLNEGTVCSLALPSSVFPFPQLVRAPARITVVPDYFR